MNLANCGKLTTRPEHRTWYRAIQPQHQSTALQTSHTKVIPTRYNQGRNLFEILYVAEDPVTALYEVQAMLGSPLPGMVSVPNPHQAWVVLNVHVVLQRVADLTRVGQQRLLVATAQELTGDWRGYHLRGPMASVSQPRGLPAPTQQLGEALFKTPGIEGFRTISAKVPTHMILAVFPQKLDPQSNIKFLDQNGNVMHSITGSPQAPSAARRRR